MSAAAIPRSSRNASNVCTLAASRCQSGPERRYMPSGMLSVQKPSGRPTTTVSMPASMALAAVAMPYGPPPITTSIACPVDGGITVPQVGVRVRVARGQHRGRVRPGLPDERRQRVARPAPEVFGDGRLKFGYADTAGRVPGLVAADPGVERRVDQRERGRRRTAACPPGQVLKCRVTDP